MKPKLKSILLNGLFLVVFISGLISAFYLFKYLESNACSTKGLSIEKSVRVAFSGTCSVGNGWFKQ